LLFYRQVLKTGSHDTDHARDADCS